MPKLIDSLLYPDSIRSSKLSFSQQHMLYFNEIVDYAADWLQNLWPTNAYIERASIIDLTADEVEPWDRVHLFAGIGGWEYALMLSGWPSSEKVWTGSCPCQPFSVAGKQKGEKDARHLWPEMFRLISSCRPPVVFGEQVAGKLGLEWFDGVRTDLEKIGYSVGMAVLPAASVGSPHRRDRIFWVADTQRITRDRSVVWDNKGSHSRVVGEEWNDYYTYPCSDEKMRRVGSRVQPLDARVSGDLERLCAYGNSIVPQVAAEFIKAYMEARGITCTGR